MKTTKLILSATLVSASFFAGSELCAQTTVYFDLKKTNQPCNTTPSVAAPAEAIGAELPYAEASPNPFSELVYLRTNGNMVRVTVHDISGKLLETIDAQGNKQLNIFAGNLPNGIYLFIITFENGAKTSLKLCKTY